MTPLLISSLTVSGIVILWRTTRKHFEGLDTYLESRHKLIGTPFTCGVCFTFWVSLGVAALMHAFIAFPAFALPWISIFFLKWMCIGVISLLVTYAFVFVFEVSHYYAHKASDLHKD